MLFPSSWWSYPNVPVSRELSDEERDLVTGLFRKLTNCRPGLELDHAYYLGEQLVQNLRIAVPKEIEDKIRAVLGWGAVAVEPLVERLAVDGFRLPDETEVNAELAEIWDASDMGSRQSMLFTDMLTMRRGYLMVGTREDGSARITVESPLNVAVDYAPDGETTRAALVMYSEGGKQRASLMRPGSTLVLEQDENKAWTLVRRDDHRLDVVPLERVANRPLTHSRDGRSEITAPMRTAIDNTARTLLGQTVAGEIYAAPRWAILGAQESDFQDSSGNPKSGYSTFISRIFGLERDDDGNLPAIHQFAAYDPSTFTKVVEMYASQFSGMAAATPGDLGLYTQGNPTSAEALKVSNDRRNRRARLRQRESASPLVRSMQHGIRIQNNGRLPDKFRRFGIEWAQLDEPVFSAEADGVAKAVESGVLPASSDVTLRKLGFGPIERAQIERDRRADALADLRAIRDSVNADADGI